MENNLKIMTYVYSGEHKVKSKYHPVPLWELDDYNDNMRKLVLESIKNLIGNNFEMKIVTYEHWPNEYIEINPKLSSETILKDFVSKMGNKYIKLNYKIGTDINLYVNFETFKSPETSRIS